MLGCVVGGAGTGLWVKFDFGSARSTVVRDRPDLGYGAFQPEMIWFAYRYLVVTCSMISNCLIITKSSPIPRSFVATCHRDMSGPSLLTADCQGN